MFQMAYELHGLLAGNVSIVTGENIKPSYGGDDEAFLRKVVTPIYRVIETVCRRTNTLSSHVKYFVLNLIHFFIIYFCSEYNFFCFHYPRKPRRTKMGMLLTQIGAIMMIWTNISGLFDLPQSSNSNSGCIWLFNSPWIEL